MSGEGAGGVARRETYMCWRRGRSKRNIRKEVCWVAERAGGVSWGLRRTKGVSWGGEGTGYMEKGDGAKGCVGKGK
jgi:hypothetical protein